MVVRPAAAVVAEALMAVRGGGAASTRRRLRRRVGCGICKALAAATTNKRRLGNHIGMNESAVT